MYGTRDPFLGYIDFMYSREGVDSKGLISEVTAVKGEGTTVPNVDYFTTIFNLDYRVASHWNMYVKGVYEQGNVFKSNRHVFVRYLSQSMERTALCRILSFKKQ